MTETKPAYRGRIKTLGGVMTRKVKSCYGCYAYSHNACLLNYKTEIYAWVGGTGLIRPVKCCHKPRTVGEYIKRLSEVIQ